MLLQLPVCESLYMLHPEDCSIEREGTLVVIVLAGSHNVNRLLEGSELVLW